MFAFIFTFFLSGNSFFNLCSIFYSDIMHMQCSYISNAYALHSYIAMARVITRQQCSSILLVTAIIILTRPDCSIRLYPSFSISVQYKIMFGRGCLHALYRYIISAQLLQLTQYSLFNFTPIVLAVCSLLLSSYYSKNDSGKSYQCYKTQVMIYLHRCRNRGSPQELNFCHTNQPC